MPPWDRPKKAGDVIACPRCAGKGYTLRGLQNDYPVECSRCHGSGNVTIAKAS